MFQKMNKNADVMSHFSGQSIPFTKKLNARQIFNEICELSKQ